MRLGPHQSWTLPYIYFLKKGVCPMTNFTRSPTFDAANASQKAELLLRRLGVRRTLVGFDYTVYMSVQVAANPSSLQLITKRLYRETAKQFHTTSIAVERAVRTVIGDCWKLEDHSLLDTLAGRRLTRSPSNSVFIDLVAGYLRYPLS